MRKNFYILANKSNIVGTKREFDLNLNTSIVNLITIIIITKQSAIKRANTTNKWRLFILMHSNGQR